MLHRATPDRATSGAAAVEIAAREDLTLALLDPQMRDAIFDDELRASTPDVDERWIAARGRALGDSKRRAVERAEVASRVKDDVLATVSHELRTPLDAILAVEAVRPSADATEIGLETSVADAALEVIADPNRMGAAVSPVPGVAEAMSTLHREPPDVVVSDIAIAREDGISFVRRLRESDDPRIRRLLTKPIAPTNLVGELVGRGPENEGAP